MKILHSTGRSTLLLSVTNNIIRLKRYILSLFSRITPFIVSLSAKEPGLGLFFLTALILRLFLAFFGTARLDMGTFVAWSRNLAENGPAVFYRGWSDYLPGYLYVLWGLGKLQPLIAIPADLFYKLPAILADLATGYLLFKIVSAYKSAGWGIFTAGIYLFNPAVLANSALWGQVDSLTALFSLLAIYLSAKHPAAAGIVLALGTIIKPQAALAGLVVLFLSIIRHWSVKNYLILISSATVLVLVAFYPFSDGQPLADFIIQRISLTLNQYPYTSVNAFSFWGLGGFWRADNVVSAYFGYLVIFIVALITSFRIGRKTGGEWFLAAIVFLAGFMFQTRMHERHLLPVLAPLTIWVALRPAALLPYLILSATYCLNLRFAFVWITQNFKYIFSTDIIRLLIGANLVSLLLLLKNVWSNNTQNWPKITGDFWLRRFFRRFGEAADEDFSFPSVNISRRKLTALLAGVMLFSLLARILWLNIPEKDYFDEVYHAFTARLVLHSDPKAWEWWNPHPEGYAYEWTHPPLAKMGMALGMAVLGENALGWRLPGAILGVGCVYLVYLLSKTLFADTLLGILAAGVFSLDGLTLVMSRIGMNDTYMLFFVLLSLYLFIKEKSFYSSLAFGLAIASKWSAVYSLPIFAVTFLILRKKFNFAYFWFVIIPPLIYLGSYFQMFLTGHGLDIFWGMQKQMWWYHTNLKATHAYTSPWWSWPLLLRPVYLYTSDEIGGVVARIYNSGNPAVFWFGLWSVIYFIVLQIGLKFRISIEKLPKRRELSLILFSYLIFFVPWAASPRIMFFYHYLPSLPFLSITAGYLLRKNPRIIPVFLIVSSVLFLYFYPHWAGLAIPMWLDKSYYWFTSWR